MGTRTQSTVRQLPRQRECGQALLELMFVLLILLLLLFGLIDFGRVIYERQILTNLSREGANLASRGTSLSNTVAAIMVSAAPLNLSANGRVIITAVVNNNGVLSITAQLSQGGYSAASRIGNGVGSTATLPVTATKIPPVNQTLYVAEVFYGYTAITPLGALLGATLPTTLYDAAYF